MKPWTEDILDQLSTAHLLAHANIYCGERLAMIIVDNAVEYTCKTYVVRKGLISSVIKKTKWDEVKKNFHQVLDLVAKQEPKLAPYVTTISGYHDTRNNLYHGGQPVTVKASTVDEYSKLARVVLQMLLGVSEDKAEQEKRIAAIHSALLGQAKKEVKAGVTFESVNTVIRFSTVANVKMPDAICLVLHGFPIHKGEPPTFDQLKSSLALSGHPTTKEILSTRLSELRKNKLIRKDQLTLTSTGKAKLSKKYLS